MAETFGTEEYYQLAQFLCHAKLTEYGLHTSEQETLAVETIPLEVAPELYQLLIALSTHDLNSARFAFKRTDDGCLNLKVTLPSGKSATTTVSHELTQALLNALPEQVDPVIKAEVLPIPAILKQIEQQLARRLPNFHSYISAKIENMHADESMDIQLTIQPDARGEHHHQHTEQMKTEILNALKQVENDTNTTVNKSNGLIDVIIRGVSDLAGWYHQFAEQIEATLIHQRRPGLDSSA